MKVFVSFFAASLLLVAACKNKTAENKEVDTTMPFVVEQEQPKEEEVADTTQKTLNQKVKVSTSYGDIVLLLYDKTPKHRDNFIKLIEKGFYTDLLFHRVMKTFMIQGGDPQSKNAPAGMALGSGGPSYTIPAEFNPKLYHKRGALAAARQPDQVNPEKESSGSQFYIVQGRPFSEAELNSITQQGGPMFTDEQKKIYQTAGGAPFLDMQYTVFGEVVEGMDVIDKIAAQSVDENNRPFKDIKFSITLVKP